MLLDKALKKAKRTDEEKVGLNIKVPIGLKNDFDNLCKEHGVSMTSMMLALIETVVEESKGFYEVLDAESLLKLNNDINRLQKEIDNLCTIETGVDGNEISIPYAALDKDVAGLDYYHTKVDELHRLKKIFELVQGNNK